MVVVDEEREYSTYFYTQTHLNILREISSQEDFHFSSISTSGIPELRENKYSISTSHWREGLE